MKIKITTKVFEVPMLSKGTDDHCCQTVAKLEQSRWCTYLVGYIDMS